MTLLLFLLVLFVLILVHEFGHFITAKWAGMRVDEFGIGFPPRLFGKRVGETEYTINALPIGGFVKIYGEDPTQVGTDPDRSRSFSAKSKGWQLTVLLAGIVMNIFFAWLLFIAVFLLGTPTEVTPETASEAAALVVVDVLADSPAAAVLEPGDRIIAVEGLQSDTFLTAAEFSSYIEQSGGQSVELTVQSIAGEREVALEPRTAVIEGEAERYAVGVALALVETKRETIVGAVTEASRLTISSLQGITVGLYTLISQSVTGQADFSQVAGPVGIAGLVGDAAKFGLTSLLMFTAFISLNLAIVNLLPIPALDGGRVLFVLVETILRRDIDPVWLSRVNLFGMALLLLLMVAVTYNDIVRLL